MSEQPNNPLHGITLEKIVTQLEQHYGWEALAKRIDIRCFKSDPSIKSSLKFLRKTPWARTKVENLYLRTSFNKPAKASAKSGAKPSKKPSKRATQPSKAPHQQVAATSKAQTTINQKAEQTPKTPEPEATAAIEAATATTSTANTTTAETVSEEIANAAATSDTTTESTARNPATSKATQSDQNKRRFSGGNSANNKRRF